MSGNKHSTMRAIVASGERQAGNVTRRLKSKQGGRKNVCLMNWLSLPVSVADINTTFKHVIIMFSAEDHSPDTVCRK